MLRRLLIVLLVLQLAPGLGELIESAWHLAEHGDFVHSVEGEHQGGEREDEHGCSPLMHLCGCHASAATTPATTIRITRPAAPAPTLAPAFLDGRSGRDAEPPPHRPPIS